MGKDNMEYWFMLYAWKHAKVTCYMCYALALGFIAFCFRWRVEVGLCAIFGVLFLIVFANMLYVMARAMIKEYGIEALANGRLPQECEKAIQEYRKEIQELKESGTVEGIHRQITRVYEETKRLQRYLYTLACRPLTKEEKENLKSEIETPR
ncbi:MAG: hypothetical protein A2Y09_01225 [Planctomycetes bacterium GWA2_39_15]|nr:MAG: hypothetical protein A2Y09_01225 [Planctomycetes bacterium GWA2_39_15]